MDDEDYEEETVGSCPWSWKGFGADAAQLVANVLQSGAMFARNVALGLAQAHNHGIDQRQFQQQASLEIETITNPEE